MIAIFRFPSGILNLLVHWYLIHCTIAEALPLKGRVLKLFRLKTKVYIRPDRNEVRVQKNGQSGKMNN
jgi:hypothetical protein